MLCIESSTINWTAVSSITNEEILDWIDEHFNDIIEIDSDKPIDFEVEEIDEENEEEIDEEQKELDAESFMKMQCENCEYYCPYCGECTLGE